MTSPPPPAPPAPPPSASPASPEPSAPSRFQRLRGRLSRLRWSLVAVTVLWLLSLAGIWHWASLRAAPQLAATRAELDTARRELAVHQARVKELVQRETTLSVSDRISRAANNELQNALSERDEEIAGLRADVAFYERLVGATGQRRGLSVHSAQFAPEAGGTWHYEIVLTQNLNRGAISRGEMRFAVEGVRGGKLATIGWEELHQREDAPGQEYSFRYFQRIDGSVILPGDFTPQRVRVSLRGGGASVDQAFDWDAGPRNGG